MSDRAITKARKKTRTAEADGWGRFQQGYMKVPCDLCDRQAAWAHPQGGRRCRVHPPGTRPGRSTP